MLHKRKKRKQQQIIRGVEQIEAFCHEVYRVVVNLISSSMYPMVVDQTLFCRGAARTAATPFFVAGTWRISFTVCILRGMGLLGRQANHPRSELPVVGGDCRSLFLSVKPTFVPGLIRKIYG